MHRITIDRILSKTEFIFANAQALSGRWNGNRPGQFSAFNA